MWQAGVAINCCCCRRQNCISGAPCDSYTKNKTRSTRKGSRDRGGLQGMPLATCCQSVGCQTAALKCSCSYILRFCGVNNMSIFTRKRRPDRQRERGRERERAIEKGGAGQADSGWHMSHDGSTNELQLFRACF